MSSSVPTARELKPILEGWGFTLDGKETHSDLLEAYYFARGHQARKALRAFAGPEKVAA